MRRLKDETQHNGVSILYHEIPTKVDAATNQPRTELNGSSGGSETNLLDSRSNANGSLTADDGDTTIVYIGGESLSLTNLLMTNSSSEVC